MPKKLYIFFSLKNKSLKCFYIGVNFEKNLLKVSKKRCYLEISRKFKYSLLNLLFSKICFLITPTKYKMKKFSSLKDILIQQKTNKWIHIKKILKNQINFYELLVFKKKKLEIISVSLWETAGKFFSLMPNCFLFNPIYGENMVDHNQQNEFNFSINYFKAVIFCGKNLFMMVKKYRYETFLGFFHSSPEHILSILAEEALYSLYIILIKLFLVKLSNPINYRPTVCIERFSLLNNLKENYNFTKNYFKKFLNLNYNTFIKKLPKENTRLRPHKSFKHSWGGFSLNFLETLTLLLEYRGSKIKSGFKNLIEISNRTRKKTIFFFELNQSITIDATFLGNLGRLLNHDCKPNCFTRVLKHSYKNYVFIITKRNISRLDEICYDYRINIDESDFDQIQCLCFNFDCKKELII